MIRRLLLAVIGLSVATGLTCTPKTAGAKGAPAATTVALPAPDREGRFTLEQTLATRRSTREFAPEDLSLAEAGQLLWAAQGITGEGGKRTAPSARAVYPLEVYVVANRVAGLTPGTYRYDPEAHALAAMPGEGRAAVAAATTRQAFVAEAPLVVIVTGDSLLAAEKFGPRAERWVAMETGFVVQDVYLQATALGLGTVMVGGYLDAPLRAVGLRPGRVPYAVMPVGRKK